jgi:hypothetical protein
MEASMLSAVAMSPSDFPNPARMFFTGPFLLFWGVILVVFIVGWWKLFEKAGHPGWACLIPIYNFYLMLKIAGRPGWWLILMLIPLVNFIISAVVAIDIAKAFGQSGVFGFFLNFLLGGIGYVILGFGNYRYLGPPNQAMAATM